MQYHVKTQLSKPGVWVVDVESIDRKEAASWEDKWVDESKNL